MSMMNYIDEFARLGHTPQQEMAERAVNKLSRTFATLMGALKHYRTGGEQKLTVRHVSVSDGGQAIVGTITQAPRDVLPEKTPNATPALTDARQIPMESVGASVNRFRSGAGIQMISKHLRNTSAMLSSPRCGARTRAGKPCRSPAVSGKRRCRMHGGAPGSGAPRGNKNAMKHGLYTRKAIEERRKMKDFLRQVRQQLQAIG